jgi:DinB superfamily
MTTNPITGETWGENLEAVRAYLLREAKQPLSALQPKLQAAYTALRAQLEGVSDHQAQFAPPNGEGEDAWGIAEVLRHIASVEPIMAQRVSLLGSGQSTDQIKPTYPGYLEDVATRQMADLLTTLDQTSSELHKAIQTIDGHERLDTLAAHRRFGELNCRGWVALHTLHLHDHTRQIGKLKGLPGYPSS